MLNRKKPEVVTVKAEHQPYHPVTLSLEMNIQLSVTFLSCYRHGSQGMPRKWDLVSTSVIWSGVVKLHHMCEHGRSERKLHYLSILISDYVLTFEII